MASSSVIFTGPCPVDCIGGGMDVGAAADCGVCATARNPLAAIVAARTETATKFNGVRMEFKPQPASDYVFWMCRETDRGTRQGKGLSGGWSACGNATNFWTRNQANFTGFGS